MFFKIFSLFFLILTVSCTPFVDQRFESGKTYTVGTTHDRTVSVCYNDSVSSQQEIINIAKQYCEKQSFSKLTFQDHDYGFCRLTTPHRAFFQCS